MHELDTVVARLEATVANEAQHISRRIDRQEARQDERHREHQYTQRQTGERLAQLEALTERLVAEHERIAGEWKNTNGRVSAHEARLREGDRNFDAIWRALRGFERHARDGVHIPITPSPLKAFERRMKRDVGLIVLGGGLMYGLTELIRLVNR